MIDVTPPPYDPNAPKAPLTPPRGLVWVLIGLNILLSLAPLRYGHSLHDWLVVTWQWVLMFGAIPLGICVLALPLKWRDPTFNLKLTYLMGLFVAFIVIIQMHKFCKGHFDFVSWTCNG